MTEPISAPAAPGVGLLLSRGYGLVPKAVMQDRRLTPVAKALYAYLCSFAGRGGVAFPTVDKITYDMAIGREAYYRHMGQLRALGYVAVTQTAGAGRFGRNLYTLTDGPAQADDPRAEEPRAENPPAEQPPAGGPESEQPQRADPPANNTKPENNNPKNNTPEPDEEEGTPTPRGGAATAERKRGPSAPPDGGQSPLERAFRESFGRAAAPAERAGLRALLDGCEEQALIDMMGAASGFAPGAPLPYLRAMVRRCRADAAALGLLRGEERLGWLVAGQVEFRRDRGDLCGAGPGAR